MEGQPKNEKSTENAINRRLTQDRVQKLLDEYGPQGLSEEGEYFVIDCDDGSKVYFHKWEEIPISLDGGKTITGGTPIKEHIELRLKEKNDQH